MHLTGDGGRFHGLLSQRAIEVLWLGANPDLTGKT